MEVADVPFLALDSGTREEKATLLGQSEPWEDLDQSPSSVPVAEKASRAMD